MFADLIVLLALVVVGIYLQFSLQIRTLPTPSLGGLARGLIRQPWLTLVILAFMSSALGWVDRVHRSGLERTLDTARGGPTSWEFDLCHQNARVRQPCPYGGEVHPITQVCSIHGAPR